MVELLQDVSIDTLDWNIIWLFVLRHSRLASFILRAGRDGPDGTPILGGCRLATRLQRLLRLGYESARAHDLLLSAFLDSPDPVDGLCVLIVDASECRGLLDSHLAV